VRKVFLFPSALALVTLGAWVLADSYNCSGAAPCPECDGQISTVTCQLVGSTAGSTSCNTTSTGNSITCEVRSGTEVIARTTSYCRPCDSVGGGGNPDGGQFCDPLTPDWWAYCSVFPVF